MIKRPGGELASRPLRIVERTFSTYWALYWYFTRGGYPFGDKVLSKGTGRAWRASG